MTEARRIMAAQMVACLTLASAAPAVFQPETNVSASVTSTKMVAFVIADENDFQRRAPEYQALGLDARRVAPIYPDGQFCPQAASSSVQLIHKPLGCAAAHFSAFKAIADAGTRALVLEADWTATSSAEGNLLNVPGRVHEVKGALSRAYALDSDYVLVGHCGLACTQGYVMSPRLASMLSSMPSGGGRSAACGLLDAEQDPIRPGKSNEMRCPIDWFLANLYIRANKISLSLFQKPTMPGDFAEGVLQQPSHEVNEQSFDAPIIVTPPRVVANGEYYGDDLCDNAIARLTAANKSE